MRIAYLISRYGREYIANETHGEIVRELQALGVNITVVTFGSRTTVGGAVGTTTGEYGEPVVTLPLDTSLPLRALNKLVHPLTHYNYFAALVAELRRWLRRNRFDLLHVEGTYPLGAAVWLATRGSPQPYVITTTGGDLFDLAHHGYGYGRYPLPRWLIQQTLRDAAWLRANSPMMQNLACYLGADPRRTTMIPVSIGDSCYPPAGLALQAVREGARHVLRQQYGWNEPRWVVSIGRLITVKAPEQIILAALAIIKRLGPTRFIIAGPSSQTADGDYLAMLQSLAQKEGVAECIAFPGQLTLGQVQQFMAASDVFVVPSVIEGLNRVTIEAGAVGTPTIITATAGAAPLVQSYGSGLVIPPGDHDALADAVVGILDDENSHRMFEQGGLRFAAAQRAGEVARQLRDVYGVVLGN